MTDGTGKAVGVWNFTKDTALTAKWTPKQYMLTLVVNNDSGGYVWGSGLVDFGSTASIGSSPKGDYTFVGWYDENDELITQNANYDFEMEADRTLTAKFSLFTLTIKSDLGGTVRPRYVVNFDLNGGSGGAPEPQYITADQLLAYPVNSTPTREGYMFRGWYATPSPALNEIPYNFTKAIDGDMTLYAGWYGAFSNDIIIELNVRFKTVDLQGVTTPDNCKSLYFCPVYNGDYTFTYESWQSDISSSEEDYSGMSFTVYNVTGSGSDTLIFNDSFKDRDQEYTKTLHLYAGRIYRIDAWRVRNDNTNYFFSVGVTGNGERPSEGGRATPMAAQTPMRSGTQITIVAEADPGYEFLGWYDENDVLVSMEQTLVYTMPYSTKVLTAKWRLKNGG